MDKKQLAAELHHNKYNCAQAVACAFADDLGVDKELLFKAMEGFGAGMGGMQGTCGALSGAIALAGIVHSDGNLGNPGTKAATYKYSKEMHRLFTERAGSSVCCELKGVETGQVLCSCADCISLGVEIVQEVLGL